MGALGGLALQVGDQVAAGDGPGRDHQGVGHVPANRVVLDAHRDVGDRRLEALPCPFDQVLASEPEPGLVQTGEQHLPRGEGAHGVVEREPGIRVHDRPHRLDAEVPQHRLGHLDPAQRRLAHLVAVDDLAGHRLVLGRDDGDLLDARVDPLANRLEQPAAAGHLVEEGEDGAPGAVRGCTGGGVRRGAHVEPAPAVPATAGSALPTSASAGPRIA